MSELFPLKLAALFMSWASLLFISWVVIAKLQAKMEDSAAFCLVWIIHVGLAIGVTAWMFVP